MRAKPQIDPPRVSRREWDELRRLLDDLHLSQGAMNLEQVNGLFTALVCGPGEAQFDLYLPVIFGRKPGDDAVPGRGRRSEKARALLRQHWLYILSSLQGGKPLRPVLLSDEDAEVRGQDWAAAFMLAVGLRPGGWDALINSDEYGDWVLGIQCLAIQQWLLNGGKPLTVKERSMLIEGAAIAPGRLYKYFHPH
jgi:uncharacterized protein